MRWRTASVRRTFQEVGGKVIVLGIILLVISFVVGIHLLWVLGALLLVVGVVLALAGATGRAIGGRPHYF